jgi:signal transduction histidine kinase
LKFTPEGGQIDVRARAHNGEAEISVADTGEGIAPEQVGMGSAFAFRLPLSVDQRS